MTNQIKKPLLKPYSKDKFELEQDYVYKDIVVPKGYLTNGANIPRVFWIIFPPNSPEYLSAIVIHDYLCDLAEKKHRLDCSYHNSSLNLHSQTNVLILKKLNTSKKSLKQIAKHSYNPICVVRG